MKRIAFILTAFCIVANAYGAEDVQGLFRELTAQGTSGQRRDALVTELSTHSFSEVRSQIVETLCSGETFGSGKGTYVIYNPTTAKPWLEKDCPEQQKISCAAGAIWEAVIDRAKAGSLSEKLAALSLEARTERERMLYLFALESRHYNEQARAPLERLANDPAHPPEIGIMAAKILLQKEDANTYFPVLIGACKRMKDPLSREIQFRFATQGLSGKLTAENKRLFLNYGFSLLSEIDDGKSGRGYFLARALGDFIGITPIQPGEGPFTPDDRESKYQGEHGLNDSFDQDTVNNARKWWRDNEHLFIEPRR